MKKCKNIPRKICLIIITILLLGVTSQKSLANNTAILLAPVEYTEEFKEYLKLSEEEKSKVLQPRMFEVPTTNIDTTNPLKFVKLKGSLTARYSLKDIIGENVTIKNQMQTNSCWAFASIASLETNLALRDYYNGYIAKVYDFSERHMEYKTSRNFANGKINTDGLNRKVGDGGNYFQAELYLKNGYGAINESDMPFENNDNIIDINQIQNKNIVTKLCDTVEFPPSFASSITVEEKNKIKEHIKNYGAVFAGINGASGIMNMGDCYNNDTGALYCDNSFMYPRNHGVAIVGWDDNYSVDNFNEKSKPKNNGAWIAKNSWGEKIEYTLEEMKEQIFSSSKSQCISRGWNEASQISDDFAKELFIENGYFIENNKAVQVMGDNGYIHISYEDVNVYKTLWGIEKATTSIDHDNIYMYDKYGQTSAIRCSQSPIYLANIFNKKTDNIEYLTEVSLYAPETYTCTVYVNLNGTSKARNDLQQVQLKAGNSETISSGYHTLEFLTPLKIEGDSFTVVIEIQSTDYFIDVALESKLNNVETYSFVETESGKCFFTNATDFENNIWLDCSKLSEQNASLPDGDSTIKAFTINTINDVSLKNIEITTPPTKTSYFEGDNFDKTGMVVTAKYNNGKSTIINDYNITNGNNLKEGQKSVTITYEDKTVNQTISVEKNSVTNLKIKTPPTKTDYKEGQNFDKNGMVVEATYKDGTTKIITDYTIENGNNLKRNQTELIISYGEKTVKQPITVTPNILMEIIVTKAPKKTKYVAGQNFDKTGMVITGIYQDESTQEILDYTIENGTNLIKEQSEVTIEYEGKTTIQAITVEEKTIISIQISKMPTKTTYIQNKEELDLNGGKVKVIYNDETYEEISMLLEKVVASGYSNKELGDVIITLQYESNSTTFKVQIIKEITAENSNFDNAKGMVKNIKLYTYTNKDKKEYALMTVEISDIVRSSNNDNYEYYYYLSSNQAEDNIENWVKIEDKQNNSNKLTFIINTNDIWNYGDTSSSENLYLYIKEVVIKGGEQKTAKYGAFELKTTDNTEIYVDDVKYDTNAKKNEDNPKDDSIANKQIPYAGNKIISFIILLGVAVIIVLYIKNRTYKDIK